ncbi:uncharacterized protein LOC121368655 [Gigantopelta aegis]|uniref:uncharacterized protein LOC121368655 n=1 Tax=Gigantopelta aegis TaxID=1735272 RepID=UPI001B88D32C|nr:uncharacterized protein LOC121368655 [Gigantopelta aegis]
MVNYCRVVGCHNRSDRETQLMYYRLPKVIKSQGKDWENLTSERRRLWLQCLQQNFDGKNLENIRVCSAHFITGQKAELFQKDNPDWIPSVNMVCHKPKDEKSAVSPAVTRFKRRQNRSQKKVESEVTAAEALPPPDTTEEPPLEDGKEVQTDVTGPLMASMMDELQTLRTENRALTLQVQNTVHKYDKSFFEGKPEKVLLYTGFPTFQILLTLFVYLEPFLPTKKSLNKFEMLILTLMRLRLNVTASFLAYEFNVSLSTVSRVLIDVIDVMFVRMKPLIIWPSRENLRKTMPIQFRKYFGTKMCCNH